MKYPPLLILPIALAVSQAWADTDPTPEETVTLSPVTVTGTQQEKANRVTFNPKAALQPLPAGDGADLLQSVPNMSIIRKGGSSGVRCSVVWVARASPSMPTTSLFMAVAVCAWTRRLPISTQIHLMKSGH